MSVIVHHYTTEYNKESGRHEDKTHSHTIANGETIECGSESNSDIAVLAVLDSDNELIAVFNTDAWSYAEKVAPQGKQE